VGRWCCVLRSPTGERSLAQSACVGTKKPGPPLSCATTRCSEVLHSEQHTRGMQDAHNGRHGDLRLQAHVPYSIPTAYDHAYDLQAGMTG
jgi:hypothetical protein